MKIWFNIRLALHSVVKVLGNMLYPILSFQTPVIVSFSIFLQDKW